MVFSVLPSLDVDKKKMKKTESHRDRTKTEDTVNWSHYTPREKLVRIKIYSLPTKYKDLIVFSRWHFKTVIDEGQGTYMCAFYSFPFRIGVLIMSLLYSYSGLWEADNIFWLFGATEATFGHNAGHEFWGFVSDAQSALNYLEEGIEYILYIFMTNWINWDIISNNCNVW